jgi:hypothetical protein
MNRHLNIFNFFNGSGADYLEDNLSRAFALCLKYDPVFLDKVLKAVLPESNYTDLFNTDFPDYQIKIDLQNRTTDLENFNKIIAVACSGMEVTEFEGVIQRETETPETDVSIVINDTCIIFEFKRTAEDCAAQLKCQAEKIKANCSGDPGVIYQDLSWGKIVRMLLNVSSLQKQINAENPFTSDFIKFLENFPEWFPSRLLRNIPFPKNEDDPNFYYLNSRLNQIKNQIYGPERTKEYIGRFNRFVVRVDFRWINEVSIAPEQTEKGNFIVVRFHLGDTKGQGYYFFKNNPHGVNWTEFNGKYPFSTEPYIRFAHLNSSRLWIRPSLEESKLTHNQSFFAQHAGKHQRDSWREFEKTLDRVVPAWREKCSLPSSTENCDWENVFERTNRGHFDVSMGTMLTFYLPYEKCQNLDDRDEKPKIARVFREIIEETRKFIDRI